MTSQEKWVRECLGKKKYRSFSFAEKMIKKIKTERNVDLYTYCCPNCQGFHLTKRKVYNDGQHTVRVS